MRPRALLLTLLCIVAGTPLVGTSGAQETPTDLLIGDMQFNGTFVEGTNGRFGVYAQNWGSPTAADTLVRFEIDGAWLGDATLAAGFQGVRLVEAPETWTVTVGAHEFVGTVDASDAIAEGREENNVGRWRFEGAPDVPPPPQRETVFSWHSYSGSTTAVETLDVDHATAYTDVRWGLWCDDSAVQLFLDGQLVATCGMTVASGHALPSELSAGRHRFTVVYVGSPTPTGAAGIDATGVPVVS